MEMPLFGAYRGLPPERRQLCWTHLRRDFVGFAAWGGATGPWGTDAVALVEKVFAVWHQFRVGEVVEPIFNEADQIKDDYGRASARVRPQLDMLGGE